MRQGRIESVKVVPDIFQFGTGNGDKTHTAEDGTGIFDRLADRVFRADRPAAARQSYIDLIFFVHHGFQSFAGGVERVLNGSFRLVERLTGIALGFVRQFAHHGAESSDRAIAAERTVFDGIDIRFRLCCFQIGSGGGSDLPQFCQKFLKHNFP